MLLTTVVSIFLFHLWRKIEKVSQEEVSKGVCNVFRQISRVVFVFVPFGKNLVTELPPAGRIRYSHLDQRSAEAWQIGQ